MNERIVVDPVTRIEGHLRIEAEVKDGKVVDGQVYETAGEYVLIMTARGDSVEKARNRVYRSIDQISFPNMMFRNDIGLKLEGQLPKLHDFGYAEEMDFS